MTELQPADGNRRRWINLGEGVAVVGLIISGLALWNSWGRDDPTPTVLVEKPRAIPLALRGTVRDDGKALTIAPVEPGHALESLTVTVAGKPPIDLGSDPSLSASAIEALLAPDVKREPGTLKATIAADYIEAGTERHALGHYAIGYRWVSGGLFGGHDLRLTRLTRG